MSRALTDVIDFEEFGRDPALADAIADAQARSALRATLVAQRKISGLTQKDISTAMETTQSAVSDFERAAPILTCPRCSATPAPSVRGW